MKKRIKIDSALLSSTIILSGFFYQFPNLYSSNRCLDNILDLLGLAMLLKGVFFRMAARGFKKANSRQGQGLVMRGLYSYTRNPMYLGTFLIGAGFACIVWPWWMLPIFAGLFYMRFNVQVVKEEKHLRKFFGKEYEDYCDKVPRVFPRVAQAIKMNVKKVMPWKEVWSTKEKRALIFLSLLAFVLETVQEKIVFDVVNVKQTAGIFLLAYLLFAAGLFYHYRKE
ncbi:MAG: isoprenylcysteine carboxylmethyltransferase family protein [Candidatus Omnitrophica bacterium]|nr:isoprenylcysteine carboxylmethyltransferase family protein [Candidatus Omnitrophota bacterium]